MKKLTSFILIFAIFSYVKNADATPTSLFWTNCITDVLETGDGHIDVDDYFTVFNRRGHGQFFNPDVGFLVGLFTWHDLSMEAGFDYLGGADNPLFFNGKIGMKEDKLFKHAPSFSLGIFNWGTRTKTKKRTNQNVINFVLGKSFENFLIDNLYVAGYSGNKALGKVRQGFMVGATKSFCKDKYCDGKEYYRWELAGDWASGNNFIGGGGVALIYYFTPDISIETGPVWFNSEKYNGKWKWSTQIDITFPLCNKKSSSGSGNDDKKENGDSKTNGNGNGNDKKSNGHENGATNGNGTRNGCNNKK
jgi:hypothetical protein